MASGTRVLNTIHDDSIVSKGLDRDRNRMCTDESIRIYLSIGDSVIPMRVLKSDSIATVKLKIQVFKGFLKNKQTLVHRGRELARNDCLIKDYGVSDGNLLHLIIRLSDLKAITVKTVCGKDLEFQVERYRNIGYVKQQIARKGKGLVDLKNQGLICKGEELDDLILVDDICDDGEAIIHLIIGKNVKIKGKLVEKDYELSIIAPPLSEKPVCGERDKVELQNQPQPETTLVARKSSERDLWLQPVSVNPKIGLGGVLKDVFDHTYAGIANGHSAIRSTEGTGGAYFMLDFSGNKYVSVFKPVDEEPKAVNNPRGIPTSLDGEGLKRGTRVGEGAYREVAAYILDHPRGGRRVFLDGKVGFSGVPPTMMVKCLHRGFHHPKGYDKSVKNVKLGSLQMFVNNYGSCEDMGPGAFPVQEVHKISVLDIRLANADRDAGNILISKQSVDGKLVLIPIDHGYCLPENIFSLRAICCCSLKIAPLTGCTGHKLVNHDVETVDYIMSMDAELDIALLQFHGWELTLGCARTLRISTMLLKKGVQRRMTPFEIGNLMCRETLTKESVIEEIMHEAQKGMPLDMNEAAFLDDVSQIMNRRLDEFIAKRGI